MAVAFQGTWRLRVVGKDSMYSQRIVISGSVHKTIPGEIRQEREISGDRWHLSVEHNDGSGWKRNARIVDSPDVHTMTGRSTTAGLIPSEEKP